jgi:hypothetical protein
MDHIPSIHGALHNRVQATVALCISLMCQEKLRTLRLWNLNHDDMKTASYLLVLRVYAYAHMQLVGL